MIVDKEGVVCALKTSFFTSALIISLGPKKQSTAHPRQSDLPRAILTMNV